MAVHLLETLATDFLEHQNLVSFKVAEDGGLYVCTSDVRFADLSFWSSLASGLYTCSLNSLTYSEERLNSSRLASMRAFLISWRYFLALTNQPQLPNRANTAKMIEVIFSMFCKVYRLLKVESLEFKYFLFVKN